MPGQFQYQSGSIESVKMAQTHIPPGDDSGSSAAQGKKPHDMLQDSSVSDSTVKRKTAAAAAQVQLTKRKNSPRNAIPQGRVSPATRDYLESIEAGSFRLWNVTQSQAEPSAFPESAAAPAIESSGHICGKQLPAQRVPEEAASPWFKPATVGQQTELQSREPKAAGAATSSGAGASSKSRFGGCLPAKSGSFR